MSEIPAAKELEELQEQSHDHNNRKIGLLISVLAILLAICGALGRKAENLVIVSRVDASNTWAYFQAKKLRGYQSETTHDLALALNAPSSHELAERYEGKAKKYEEESETIAKQAEAYTQNAEKWESKANRFGMGEIFLQIGVVLCSIAILTQALVFVYGGLGVGFIGLAIAVSAFFIS